MKLLTRWHTNGVSPSERHVYVVAFRAFSANYSQFVYCSSGPVLVRGIREGKQRANKAVVENIVFRAENLLFCRLYFTVWVRCFPFSDDVRRLTVFFAGLVRPLETLVLWMASAVSDFLSHYFVIKCFCYLANYDTLACRVCYLGRQGINQSIKLWPTSFISRKRNDSILKFYYPWL